MLISRQKKEENIVEYLLYMWQIEDIIRAYNFDIELINKNIISTFQYSGEDKKAMKFWYEDIIETMKLEKVTEKGHFQAIKNIIFDLNDLHLYLLQSSIHADYRQKYQKAATHLSEYQIKAKHTTKTIIETALEAMYATLLLRLQKKEITAQTSQAINEIGKMLALLAKKYKMREEDKLE